MTVLHPGLPAALRLGGRGAAQVVLFDLYSASDTVVMAGIEGKWDGNHYLVEFIPLPGLRPGVYRLAPRAGCADAEIAMVPVAKMPATTVPEGTTGKKRDYRDRFLRNLRW